jgi:hypothetical protein
MEIKQRERDVTTSKVDDEWGLEERGREREQKKDQING